MPNFPPHARAAGRLTRRADHELRRVYVEHVGSVFAFFAHSHSRAVAEDLTATTFEKVIRAWKRYDPDRAGERTWILAIARNVLIDHGRRSRLRDAVSIDEHPLLLDSLAADDQAERLDRDEVRTWLTNLPERERTVLALRYGGELSAREIGDLLELSEANVHQIISRTLRKLRATVQRTPT